MRRYARVRSCEADDLPHFYSGLILLLAGAPQQCQRRRVIGHYNPYARVILRRRAYQRYRERQRQQKDSDRKAIAALEDRLQALEVERSQLVQRVDVLQKVRRTFSHPSYSLVYQILSSSHVSLGRSSASCA